jgi:hypothetical protein
MAIFAPDPPAGTTEALHDGLRRLARASVSAVPAGPVEIARGLPVFRTTTGRWIEIETAPVAWRFVVFDRGYPFWVDVEDGAVQGVFAGRIAAAMVMAAARMEAAGADGEARILTAPLIEGGAVWIDDRVNRFWSFSPELDGSEASEAQLLHRWQLRLERLAGEASGAD